MSGRQNRRQMTCTASVPLFFFRNVFNEMQTRRIAKAVKGFNKEQMFADKLSLVAFQIQSQNT